MDLDDVVFLTYEEVLQFHADQLRLFGGQDDRNTHQGESFSATSSLGAAHEQPALSPAGERAFRAFQTSGLRRATN